MRRGLWDRETVALLFLLALMPMALAWLWFGGAEAFGRLCLALVVAGIWHVIFMLTRAQPVSFGGALSVLAVAVLSPVDLGVVPFVLGVSFGTVMAELVFGGWGRNVVNPATITLAFLGFGFPAAPWPDLVPPVAWAAVPALVLGALFGVMSLRLMAGAAGAFALAYLLGLPVLPVLPLSLIALALLVADPVASSSTRLGRWLNGALFGGLVVLFADGWTTAAPVQIVVSAALLASLAAPLLDEIAIALWVARRRRRHG